MVYGDGSTDTRRVANSLEEVPLPGIQIRKDAWHDGGGNGAHDAVSAKLAFLALNVRLDNVAAGLIFCDTCNICFVANMQVCCHCFRQLAHTMAQGKKFHAKGGFQEDKEHCLRSALGRPVEDAGERWLEHICQQFIIQSLPGILRDRSRVELVGFVKGMDVKFVPVEKHWKKRFAEGEFAAN